ncbi:MAG: DNA-processing protein DprA [Omnitrophica bacterium]|nr:DNA-processing protein DprA [Candidatus Omnitrophota bacterium]
MEIRKIGISDREYPEALKTIHRAPPKLFVNGEILPGDANAVAIVGARRSTIYGLQQCERLSYDLALKGITIVSGMARGIDTAAHKGALRAGGRTIAVLGSGHGHIYPRENKKLYAEITKNGAVISEFPHETLPMPFNFPARNRIISGLSRGVVVVEAARRSGALITADFALEQGREVFAMPGNISSSRSAGTNALIKGGAKLTESAGDVLEELESVLDIKIGREESTEVRAKNPAATLSAEEKAVFGVLTDMPKPIDEISGASRIPVSKISRVLIALEIRRLAKMLPGENFIKV